MRLKQILTNKKIVIILLVILLALIVGMMILVTPKSKGTGNKNSGTKTEQGKEDVNSKEDKEDNWENNSPELEVLEPDEVAPENSTDVPGAWGDTQDSNTQSSNTNATDKTDNTKNENASEEKENDSEESKGDEEILEDDITWGNVY